MKKISLNKGIRAIVYPFIFGIYLLFSPALARNTIHFSKFQQQPHQISGTVTDANGPIPGATVSIKGTKTIAITDFDGKYIITASPTDTLVFSFMGYKTAIVPINGRTTINVKLQEDATALQEVRVNAGYYSVKESERTGSIARITSKDIETQPVTNVLATMQGRMAGVSVTQTTGVPGGGFDIKIRGQNSIRSDGNAPLYIIDGVPYGSDPIGYNQTATTFPTVTSPLNSINPDAIELAKKTLTGAILKVGSGDDVMMSDKSADVILTDMYLIYMDSRKINQQIKEIKRLARSWIILCEFHSESWYDRMKVRFHDGYFMHNYKTLLEKHGFYDLTFYKLTPELWPGGGLQEKYGYIIKAKVPR